MIDTVDGNHFDVFLSHSHRDATWVENLARRLEDEHRIRSWLDRWMLVPGKPWQRAMAHGIQKAPSCAVFFGRETPHGWFEKEIEKALNRQAQHRDFRVIPVLLPDIDSGVRASLTEGFLELNTWVDFSDGADPDRAMHLLVSGVKGLAPGRWPARAPNGQPRTDVVEKLRHLRQLREDQLVDDAVAIDYQRKILDRLLDI
jgi:TIR domain